LGVIFNPFFNHSVVANLLPLLLEVLGRLAAPPSSLGILRVLRGSFFS